MPRTTTTEVTTAAIQIMTTLGKAIAAITTAAIVIAAMATAVIVIRVMRPIGVQGGEDRWRLLVD